MDKKEINFDDIDRGILKDYIDQLDCINDTKVIGRIAERLNISPTDDVFLKNGVRLLEDKTIVRIDYNERKK